LTVKKSQLTITKQAKIGETKNWSGLLNPKNAREKRKFSSSKKITRTQQLTPSKQKNPN